MTADDKPRGDRMTTDFFEEVLATYLEEDRIESGVLRLELADGRTRRLVVDDDTESQGPYEYVKRELDEVIYLIEANDDLLDEPIELSIPVGDVDRVVAEAKEEEAVTTIIQSSGIRTVLEHLRTVLEVDEDQDHEDEA